MPCLSLLCTDALFLNPAMMSRLVSTSLNIPSSLFVNWEPHSVLNFPMVLFSASMLLLFPSSSLFARSFL